MTTEIYLDGNATTTVLPAAIAAATQAMMQVFGNPSSTHTTGIRAKAMMNEVRQRAVRLLGAGNGCLMFNSGATEGIQTAVLSALCALRERQSLGEHIGTLLLYGATEHKAVPESLMHWNRLLGLNLELKKLPVDWNGKHDLDVLRLLANDTALICTMAANNETGVISDLGGIEKILEQTGSNAYWLVDCVQALGKLKLDLATTRIDYAPFSGHKLYAPKGIGMLYVRAGAPFTPLMTGGGQEFGLRSGTENMAGIAALGAVLTALEDGVTFHSNDQLHGFRDRLVASLYRAFPHIVFNMPLAETLPTTLNFSVPGLSSKELLNLFDAAHMRVSSGSACSAARAAPSYVLEAMHLPQWCSSSAIRMSFGPLTDETVINAACARIEHCGAALRASCLIASSLPSSPYDGVTQFTVDGANTWLVTDIASNSCVIIDPLPALVQRLDSYVRCQGYQVRAIVCTALLRETDEARLALTQALMDSMDTLDWPSHDMYCALGGKTLARMPVGDSQVYLLGQMQDEQFVTYFAFTGKLAPEIMDLPPIGPDTLLCPGRDENNLLCTTLRAEQGHVKVDTPHDMHLEAEALAQFLIHQPNAVLVDVREAYEQTVVVNVNANERVILPIPSSCLVTAISKWLHSERVPLVFFCRSGNRSHKVAACLRRLGYETAWHLNGGIALGESVLFPDRVVS